MTLGNLEKRPIELAVANHASEILSNSKEVGLTKRQTKRTCFIVVILLLALVIKLFDEAHSWFLRSSKPRFPLPRHHMSTTERELFFL